MIQSNESKRFSTLFNEQKKMIVLKSSIFQRNSTRFKQFEERNTNNIY